MADQTQNETKVIRKNDPDFPQHLNFEWLRKLGLEHLGKISGKIWTDHNLHDPGVTILEMLCYAQMDLGYRTKLPIHDILALNTKENQKEDNFFTPAQILTCNPTTITDFRKMIIDTEGVRNAWLEVADNEKPLWVNCEKDSPVAGNSAIRPELSCSSNDTTDQSYEVKLNGLYNVLIELEQNDLANTLEKEEAYKEAVQSRVEAKLHQYRNLCEDYVNIDILCKEEIGICASIELSETTDPEAIYVKILEKIYEYFSPKINYYTLNQMLDMGKTMEEIYEGRPYTTESYGFVDTYELEQVTLHREIHLSEIYNLILSIEGISSVEGIRIKGYINGIQQSVNLDEKDCKEWILMLSEGYVPVLGLDHTHFRISKNNHSFKIDKEKVAKLFGEARSAHQKAKYKDAYKYLDQEVPQGRYMDDLSAYNSIQNEFPNVYGIKEGGLSKDASVHRKAQALQLKGYLLFFDQLLAGYLSQLSHIRDLFSMSSDRDTDYRDHSTNHTYFNGDLESVPDLEKIVKHYSNNFSKELGWNPGDTIAFPIQLDSVITIADGNTIPMCNENEAVFASRAERNVILHNFRREISKGKSDITTKEDDCGFYFIIKTSLKSIGLISKKIYPSKEKAELAAKILTFLATLEKVYQLCNNANAKEYTFEIIFSTLDYKEIIQNLLEDKELYLERRNEFLDHLLARFSESFSDYALLLYSRDGEDQDEFLIDQKTRFLTHYDDISRNRGKAFDYKLNGWNSDNVVGLNKRIAAVSGIQNWSRHNLCNFEVNTYQDEFVLEIKDYQDQILFLSQEKYKSIEKASEAMTSFLLEVRNRNIQRKDDLLANAFSFEIKHANGTVIHPENFSTPEERDAKLLLVESMVNAEPAQENIAVTQYIHHLKLQDYEGNHLRKSRKQYSTKEKAETGIQSFAEKVNSQLKMKEDVPEVQLVKSSGNSNEWIDTSAFKDFLSVRGPEYRWQLLDGTNTAIIESAQGYESAQVAGELFTQFTNLELDKIRVEHEKQKNKELISVFDGSGIQVARGEFENSDAAGAAIAFITDYVERESSKGVLFNSYDKPYGWQLVHDDEVLLKSKLLFHKRANAVKDWRDIHDATGKKPKLKVDHGKDGYKILLKGVGGIVLAQSETLKNEPPKELIASIGSLLNNEKNIKYGKAGNAYGFQLPNPKDKDKVLLTSYDLFATKIEAFEAMQEVLKISQKEAVFYHSGDDANLNFSFVVQDKSKNFVADHPYTYIDEEERDIALAETLKNLKKYQLPVIFKKEYSFQFVDEQGDVLLNSSKYFKSPREAEHRFYEMLQFAGDTSNYTSAAHDKDALRGFVIKDADDDVAFHHLDQSSRENPDQLIAELINKINPNKYYTGTNIYPHRWKVRASWETPQKQVQMLFESSEEFSNKDEAEQLYKKFSDSIGKIKLSDQGNESDYTIGFKFSNNGQPFASHPQKFATIAEREDQKKAIEGYLSSVKNFRSVRAGAYKNYILKTSETQGGNTVYRVLKKDDPIAIHPCECFDQTPEKDKKCGLSDASDSLIDKLYEKAVSGYTYLEICLGGDIFLEIEHKIHYLIRNKKDGSILFISYTGYASEDEARVAFEENYLYLIYLASEKEHYGDKIAIEGAAQQELCAGYSPIAFVPRETLDHSSIDQLLLMANSYPIRYVLKESFAADCKELERKKCYSFHLLGDHKECKEDWVSNRCYDDLQEAYTAFQLFLNLLKFKGNFKLNLEYDEENEKCCCRLGIIEVSLESEKRYEENADAWKDLQFMLERSCEDGAFYTYFRKEDCCYTFAVVGEDFYLANHTIQYHTSSERDAAIQQLHASCQCSGKPILNIQSALVAGEKEGRWKFEVADDAGNIMWRSAHYYSSKSEADIEAVDALIYAREDRFYTSKDDTFILCKKGDSTDAIAIYDGKTLTKDALISAALRYPIVRQGKKYSFRHYCEDFEIPVEKIDLHPCKDYSDDKTPHESIAYEKGGIVWESARSYSSIEKALKEYARFCKQLKDITNYQPSLEDECGPYTIELIDACPCPEDVQIGRASYQNEVEACRGILARHPQCYTKLTDLHKAIARTKTCIENEGLHLVEHILLRPKEDAHCECIPNISPACDCELQYEMPDDEVCKEQEETVEVEEDECNEGGGRKYVKYIPNADPYSFQATIVLPCWTKRFGKLNFREEFEHLLYKEAPAHVMFRIFWISPEQMCAFEEQYKAWLWQLSNNPCHEGDVQCEFTNLLFGLYDCPVKIDDEELVPGCDDEQMIRFNASNLIMKYWHSGNRDNIFSSGVFKEIVNAGGGVGLLPKSSYLSMVEFPKALYATTIPVELPTANDLVPDSLAVENDRELPVENETVSEEHAAGIRRRLSRYGEDIQAIDDTRFMASESFIRSDRFMKSDPQPEQFELLVSTLLKNLKKSRTEKSKSRYEVLLTSITSYFMDKMILKNHESMDPATKEVLQNTIAKLNEQDIASSLLSSRWNGGELKKLSNAKSIGAFSKLLKSKS